jgi:hypothetical protein
MATEPGVAFPLEIVSMALRPIHFQPKAVEWV